MHHKRKCFFHYYFTNHNFHFLKWFLNERTSISCSNSIVILQLILVFISGDSEANVPHMLVISKVTAAYIFLSRYEVSFGGGRALYGFRLLRAAHGCPK
jgi:hypothetical protein